MRQARFDALLPDMHLAACFMTILIIRCHTKSRPTNLMTCLRKETFYHIVISINKNLKIIVKFFNELFIYLQG